MTNTLELDLLETREHVNIEDMPDHFTAVDRKSLTEIVVEIRYMKESMQDMRRDQQEGRSATKADVKDLWKAVTELQNYRWWLAGLMAASSVIGGAIAKLVFH